MYWAKINLETSDVSFGKVDDLTERIDYSYEDKTIYVQSWTEHQALMTLSQEIVSYYRVMCDLVFAEDKALD